jgi:coenzyme F420-reducing hydrogenase gamma subunit
MTKTSTEPKKLRIGWFTFSCCEDSTVIFTELMNERWQDWKRLLDVRHARVLQTNNHMDEMDVAFIEGALNSPRHVEKVKEIRKLAKKVVAIGACACTGLPSVQRNTFNAKQTAEIQPLLDKFDFLPKGQKLAEVITVDAMVPGCPMDEKKFLAVLDAALKEFHII